MDGMHADPLSFGALYDTLQRTTARWGDRPAYGVPAKADRAYHPAGVTFSWTETLARAQKLKEAYARSGYGHGHRVAILFAQRPEFIFHFYALNALGCSVVPINPDYLADEIRYVVEHSESCLAIATTSRLADMRGVAQALGGALPVISLEDFPDSLPKPPLLPSRAPDGVSEAVLLYTSGTTGRPKGCVLTNEYFHTFGAWYLGMGGRIAMREGAERMYNPLPLHHANCLSISLPAMLISGGALFFPDRFHASTWWRDLAACDITCLHYQGVIPNILLKLPPGEDETRHKVRFGFGSGVDPKQHRMFEERFKFPLVELWAMTETGRIMSDNHEPRLIDTRAIGRSMPGFEAKIVDDNGADAPPDLPGELLIRHSKAAPRKGFFSGYLKNEPATEESWKGGWYHTGDVAVRDASGMFHFVDRAKNIIRRSGENIAAAEIDAVLIEHPKVKQAAALAVADEMREEEVLVCIVPQDGVEKSEALAHELFTWCVDRLAYFKAPGWLIWRDSLPLTTSQRLHKIQIFAKGVDPRKEPGIIDMRALKKAPGKAPRSTA